MRLDASYYNEDYFKPGPKSSYILPFTWEAEETKYMKLAQEFKDMFHPKNTLDAGCAKGFLCKALLKLGIDAYGCDISEYAVSNCEPEVRGRLKVADIRDEWPYPDNSFDLVCTDSTLEHIEMEFLPYVASEIARISRNHVYIGIPISPDNKNRPFGDPSHRTFMPVSYWISLFYSQGLLCDLTLSSQGGIYPYSGATLIFSKPMEPWMQAVVLAGGTGTRLKPITETIPKAMVPVRSSPFIDYLLNLLKGGGVDEVVLCVGYLSEQIIEFVENGEKWGIAVSYIIEEKPLGTAGALKQALPLLKNTFLVINGDTYLPVNHTAVMDYLRGVFTIKDMGSEAVMVVYRNDPHTGCRNDVLVKDGLVVKNNKQNPEPDFNYVNAGVLALRREALRFIPEGERCDLEESLYQQLIAEGLLAAYTTKRKFYDVGTFDGIRALEAYIDK